MYVFSVHSIIITLSLLNLTYIIVEKDHHIVNMKDNHGDTPLHEACICGNVGIVQDLLEHGADPDVKNNDDISPLEIPCMANYVKVVRATGANNGKSEENRSNNNVTCCADEKGCLAVLKGLCGYKACCRMKGDVEVVPIHIAAEQGDIDIVRKHLERDESCKDLPDEQHRSPLHYAARNNQVEIIKLLLSK